MRLTCCLLLLALTGTWGAEVGLPLHRAGHTVILETVYLNGQGPFRMMVDTGNASSLIRPQVARKIGASAVYSVEQVTSGGVRRVPVVMVDHLTVGPVNDRQIEAMIGAVAMDGTDGVLGQSWLARHDYLLVTALEAPTEAARCERPLTGPPFVSSASQRQSRSLRSPNRTRPNLRCMG